MAKFTNLTHADLYLGGANVRNFHFKPKEVKELNMADPDVAGLLRYLRGNPDPLLSVEGQSPKKIPLIIPKRFRSYNLKLQRDNPDERDFRTTALPPLLSLPLRVDHTVGMSPVKDQGRLGSCVGFAVTAMKEWQEKTEHEREVAAGKRDHREGKVFDLSEQWVYYKAKSIDVWPNQEGTSIRYAMKVLHNIGAPTEKAWPYNDVEMGKPESWAPMIARWAIIKAYRRATSLTELKTGLIDGPVCIGVPVFLEFFYAGADGIVKYPANPDKIYGGHAIAAVGYDDNKQLVKFKNSWGAGWGQNGYGYFPYRYINNFLWDAWIAEDMSVTKEMLRGQRSL